MYVGIFVVSRLSLLLLPPPMLLLGVHYVKCESIFGFDECQQMYTHSHTNTYALVSSRTLERARAAVNSFGAALKPWQMIILWRQNMNIEHFIYTLHIYIYIFFFCRLEMVVHIRWERCVFRVGVCFGLIYFFRRHRPRRRHFEMVFGCSVPTRWFTTISMFYSIFICWLCSRRLPVKLARTRWRPCNKWIHLVEWINKWICVVVRFSYCRVVIVVIAANDVACHSCWCIFVAFLAAQRQTERCY